MLEISRRSAAPRKDNSPLRRAKKSRSGAAVRSHTKRAWAVARRSCTPTSGSLGISRPRCASSFASVTMDAASSAVTSAPARSLRTIRARMSKGTSPCRTPSARRTLAAAESRFRCSSRRCRRRYIQDEMVPASLTDHGPPGSNGASGNCRSVRARSGATAAAMRLLTMSEATFSGRESFSIASISSWWRVHSSTFPVTRRATRFRPSSILTIGEACSPRDAHPDSDLWRALCGLDYLRDLRLDDVRSSDLTDDGLPPNLESLAVGSVVDLADREQLDALRQLFEGGKVRVVVERGLVREKVADDDWDEEREALRDEEEGFWRGLRGLGVGSVFHVPKEA
ncbi:hypothetical protein DFJ74DRAFT_671568 [Hyaloraphidium curvatum]|nr:hypothetical protein DFJ74DRAFT_671568 [Hyaloraphidium curvatum]